ncbi:MAG: hypothetical protein LBM96_06750 [Methanobrevibacter sp.]|jgi:hypothetical protein|nr:hypothetical protein [Candidatus Methanoflexus mossambicus]
MEKKENKKIKVFIPEEIPKIHTTGAASLLTPFNIRLILFDDDIVKGESIDDTIPAVRNAQCEIVFPPEIAKTIGELLIKESKKHENKFLKTKKS